jgi:hypothetical protein
MITLSPPRALEAAVATDVLPTPVSAIVPFAAGIHAFAHEGPTTCTGHWANPNPPGLPDRVRRTACQRTNRPRTACFLRRFFPWAPRPLPTRNTAREQIDRVAESGKCTNVYKRNRSVAALILTHAPWARVYPMVSFGAGRDRPPPAPNDHITLSSHIFFCR